MRIHEVETIVGITGKNIRFYEEQGLLTPQRNKSNGYREYGDEEIAVLQRIKLLRKLGVPLEEIRQMQQGHHTVADGMRRHLVSLERDRQNIDHAIELCRAMQGYEVRLPDLDAEQILAEVQRMEQEGTTFVDKQREDSRKSRYVSSLGVTVFMVLLMSGIIWLLIFAFSSAPDNGPPLALLLALVAVPAVVILGVILAAFQRVREIGKGEIDDAKRY